MTVLMVDDNPLSSGVIEVEVEGVVVVVDVVVVALVIVGMKSS